MRIINIVDSIAALNIGIWHAAVSTAEQLSKYSIETELWYPGNNTLSGYPYIKPVNLLSTELFYISELIKTRNLATSKDIIITHGCWTFPTKWGFKFKKLGFNWIYTPHGMLEPWALRQKRVKKQIYFSIFEKRMAGNASVIRAVSSPEMRSLQQLFPLKKMILIPNGVNPVSNKNRALNNATTYLFMARLHQKKGIVPLVKAWLVSELNNRKNCRLVIAGPDQGELNTLELLINKSTNIEYVGSVYGEKKERLLNESTFFLLPSFSEGFPSSVLEAMSYGLICLISPGCNLPEALTEDISMEILPEEGSIQSKLNMTLSLSADQIKIKSEESRFFVDRNFSLQKIALLQKNLYNSLLDV